MSDLRNRVSRKLPRISASGLKYFAAIVMLIVNANTVILEKAILNLDSYSSLELIEVMNQDSGITALVGVASILRLFSGLIVPIYAFLLVEGFVHTGSFGKYLKAVAITALCSEPLYDYAMNGTLLDFSGQNPIMALAIGLVMLSAIRLFDNRAKVEKGILCLLIVLSSVFWTALLRVGCGLETVLLVAIFYCFRERMAIKTILGVLVSVMDPLGPFAFCGLIYYNGQRTLKVNKYCFYGLYPLHLLMLGIIAQFMKV